SDSPAGPRARSTGWSRTSVRAAASVLRSGAARRMTVTAGSPACVGIGTRWCHASTRNPTISPDDETRTDMEFELSDRCREYQEKMLAFMDEHIYPAEAVYAAQMSESGNPNFHPPILEELKTEARKRDLWNLFHPHQDEAWGSPGLSNLDYAPLAEIMGRSPLLAPEACNCNP